MLKYQGGWALREILSRGPLEGQGREREGASRSALGRLLRERLFWPSLVGSLGRREERQLESRC